MGATDVLEDLMRRLVGSAEHLAVVDRAGSYLGLITRKDVLAALLTEDDATGAAVVPGAA